jgi:Ca-activated chloride channel family protein
VKISGTLNGRKQEFAADVNFTESDSKNAFIPRLWATRRVGWLLDEIRMHGESKELKDEVVRLAREHGIVTPYTAFLIMEDEQRRGVPVAAQNLRELSADKDVAQRAKVYYESAKEEARDEGKRAGDQAVTNSTNLDGLKRSWNVQQSAPEADSLAKASAAPTPNLAGTTAGRGAAGGGTLNLQTATPPAENYGYRSAQNYAQQVKVVNGRAFYQNGDSWTDSTIQSVKDTKRVEIKFGSDEYFALLKKYPFVAQWMSLGSNVDVLIEDTVYAVK